jgi:Tol biopolymer transport system component
MRAIFPVIRLLLIVALAAVAWPGAADAELRIDITRGTVEPLPIAITDLRGDSASSAQVGRDLAQACSDRSINALSSRISRVCKLHLASPIGA